MSELAEPPKTSPMPVAIGDVVAGKYRMERILGASGMGVVYGATHIGIEQQVAVKFLLKKSDTDEDAFVRFAREAKFMARINSEHVVRVLDVGATADATPFIVMEHLHGEDLSRVLLRRGPLPIETAVDYVLQACDGLAAAHAAGVVHRDIKPSNLFLAKVGDGREVVKLIDFGVAKYRGTDTNPQSDVLTHTHVIVGSPRYMAPEQVRASRDVDARADVWSLAIILQELITGRPVFKGPSVSDTLVLILTEEAPRADAIRADVPAALADAIRRALARDATLRTASAAAFANELLPFVSPTRRLYFEPTFAAAPIPPPPPRSFREPLSDPSLQTVGHDVTMQDNVTRTAWDTRASIPSRRRSRALLIGGAAVALVAFGVGVGVVANRASTRPAAAAALAASEGAAVAPHASPAASPEVVAVPSASIPAAHEPAPSARAGTPPPTLGSAKGSPSKPGAKVPPASVAGKGSAPSVAPAAAAPVAPAPAETSRSLFDDPK